MSIGADPNSPPRRRTGGPGVHPGAAGPPPSPVSLRAGRPSGVLLEDVLDLLAGLLDVGLGLVRLALGLHVLVVRRLAERLLGRADLLVGHVLHLVVGAHDGAPSGVLGAVRLCRPRSAAVARGCSGRTRRFSWQTLPPPQASRRAAA